MIGGHQGISESFNQIYNLSCLKRYRYINSPKNDLGPDRHVFDSFDRNIFNCSNLIFFCAYEALGMCVSFKFGFCSFSLIAFLIAFE